MAKIAVIGLGYVGLPTAIVLADAGHDVTGIDSNSLLVDRVNRGENYIMERGLTEMLKRTVEQGSLEAKSRLEHADTYLVCVSTPLQGRSADLSHLTSAIESLTGVMEKGDLVIVESTIPPGTTENVLLPIFEKSGLNPNGGLMLAYCPERVLPGDILRELVENDRMVGGIDERSAAAAKRFYATFVRGSIHTTDARTAEVAKLMENTYRMVNIGLANEFALVCERLGVDVWKAIELANNHPRVNIHHPGPGVGGYCLTKDPWFLAGESEIIIPAAMKVNDLMPEQVLKLLVKGLQKSGKNLQSTRIAVLGLSYKGEVSDTRESPALKFVALLRSMGARIETYDPFVRSLNGRTEINIAGTIEDAVRDANAVVVMTAHEAFRRMDAEKMKEIMATPIMVDCVDILDKNDFKGWTYISFGTFRCDDVMAPEEHILHPGET